jgi:hypothetical protein
MSSPELAMLRWQFDLAWRLAEYHLPQLTDDACSWEPAPGSWSVRKSADGLWHPDWADIEPNPAPPVSIGWLTWHLLWWWSGLLDAMRGAPKTPREQVLWPGSAAASLARLRHLSEKWSEALADLHEFDLDRTLAYPWPEPRPLRIAIAWANSELMKNVAEIGIVRHLYEADQIQRRTRLE